MQAEVGGDCGGVYLVLGARIIKTWGIEVHRWPDELLSFLSNRRLRFYKIECDSWFSLGTPFPKFLGMVEHPLESYGILKISSYSTKHCAKCLFMLSSLDKVP